MYAHIELDMSVCTNRTRHISELDICAHRTRHISELDLYAHIELDRSQN